MKSIDKRLASLEAKAAVHGHSACLVLVDPGEDPEKKRREALDVYIAENGHPPSLVSVVQFVDPPRKREKD